MRSEVIIPCKTEFEFDENLAPLQTRCGHLQFAPVRQHHDGRRISLDSTFGERDNPSSKKISCILHYMRDHGLCLIPILQGRRVFLEMWGFDFLVTIVCCVSRSNTLKSWISKKSHGPILSNAIKRSPPRELAIAGITGIWQGIESFVVKYWHWVKSEANIPKRLGILRALICLVSF